jgi:hypothetical protein
MPVELMIRHSHRQKSKGILIYRQPHFNYSVEVSYDVLTVYADLVRFDRKRLMLEAEGHVVIDDGNQRQRFTSAEVSLDPDSRSFKYKGK